MDEIISRVEILVEGSGYISMYKRCFIYMDLFFGYLLRLGILDDTLNNLNRFQDFYVVKDTQSVLRSMEDGLVKL